MTGPGRRSATTTGWAMLWSLASLAAATAADRAPDVADLSARTLVADASAGRLDPCRLAETLLAAIRTDGHNAFISTRRAADLEICHEPRRVEARRSLPLAGLPVAVKDNILVAGQRATFGTSATGSYVPAETAEAVQRLIDHGAVVLGKLNLHELAGGVTSNNAVFGPVRNAYDPNSFAGGRAAVPEPLSAPGWSPSRSGPIPAAPS